MIENTFAEFKQAAEHLIGCECWATRAGKGTGSMVTLHFGEQVNQSRQPDASTTLPAISEGERGIYIEHCAWRVDSPAGVICGSTDDNRMDGPMIEGLRFLMSQKPVAVVLTPPSLDLCVTFTNSIVLRLFCDQVNQKDAYDNYSLWTPTTTYTVGPRSTLFVEDRSAC